MTKRIRQLGLMFLFAITLLFPVGQTFAAPLLSQGSANGDVWDLQFRLNILGYYPAPLDGVYGPKTAHAVRRFQADYGLQVDGVAGTRTWRALKRVSVNQQEYEMLAKLVHGEARGEPYIGQVAVAAVVMNRLQSPQFPKTIKGNIFQPLAFTAVADGQFYQRPNRSAYRAAWDAVRGWDPSGGALFYFNPETATSKWIWSRPQIKKIGNHIFTK
jgi:N-acetylmuramoyl-L-alanine amidase